MGGGVKNVPCMVGDYVCLLEFRCKISDINVAMIAIFYIGD